jgi:hypothetical protein
MSTKQPEALRLAAALDELFGYRSINTDIGKVATELRRLHAMNEQLSWVNDDKVNVCREFNFHEAVIEGQNGAGIAFVQRTSEDTIGVTVEGMPPILSDIYADSTPIGVTVEGMTLRDYFAAKAMQVVYYQCDAFPDTDWRDGVAMEAYKMADAMLKAREA